MSIAVVGSAIANKPWNGGNAWAVFNWVLGLQRLGFQVYFVEQVTERALVDERGDHVGLQSSTNLDFFRQVTEYFGCAERSALVPLEGGESYGLSLAELQDLARDADLLINISGHLTWEPMVRGPHRRAYIDLDPGYTQFWYDAGTPGSRLEGHDFYYTIGENIGLSQCPIPTSGIPWRTIRPPIVLDRCHPSAEGQEDRFTTVASWRGAYGPVYVDDTVYGTKVHEFRKFFPLPQRTDATFEIALEIYPGDWRDSDALEDNGWRLVDPQCVSTPNAFHGYVESSGAEFSAAQGMYVQTQSGWVSDRTVHYLALGKPVLVQNTGLCDRYPTEEGMLTFTTLEDAIQGVQRITSEYRAHSRAARRVAEAYFDSDKVLGRLLDEISIAPGTASAGGRYVDASRGA